MSIQNKPLNPNQNQPKKQDDTRKQSPNQGPEVQTPGRSNQENGDLNRHDQKIQAPQK